MTDNVYELYGLTKEESEIVEYLANIYKRYIL